MMKSPARIPRRVSQDDSNRTEIQAVQSICKVLCLWLPSPSTNMQWSAILSAARHCRDANDFLKDEQGNTISWQQRDNAELRKAVRHLERDFPSLARPQAK
ncbi:hypothetical protein BCR37DRAFT_377843 [Protomyces lactucae-debilis]|uniref:Uncharacterized protein n=1 Tax=Protomyces lactucae-debilis TaxID=2754530 RepID=A0A1Y2FLV0_PROLT|nr:uncharacterized protein BCR37DRAFT_377843 [Protomyces lactucae-debilis]ORY84928.1 hypothetical protein BCR37DRAFT_377843 [Protomyces lactucae-debilis]